MWQIRSFAYRPKSTGMRNVPSHPRPFFDKTIHTVIRYSQKILKLHKAERIYMRDNRAASALFLNWAEMMEQKKRK
jgi:hypothetical protein